MCCSRSRIQTLPPLSSPVPLSRFVFNNRLLVTVYIFFFFIYLLAFVVNTGVGGVGVCERARERIYLSRALRPPLFIYFFFFLLARRSLRGVHV